MQVLLVVILVICIVVAIFGGAWLLVSLAVDGLNQANAKYQIVKLVKGDIEYYAIRLSYLWGWYHKNEYVHKSEAVEVFKNMPTSSYLLNRAQALALLEKVILSQQQKELELKKPKVSKVNVEELKMESLLEEE